VEAEIDPRFPRPMSRRRWDAMVRRGELDREQHIELMRGAVVRMRPIREAHIDIAAWLVRRLNLQLDDRYRVASPAAIAANADSEPEPDVMVTAAWGRDTHPRSCDALLVIEVSHRSLSYDLDPKRVLYAETGVPEYWVVDVKRRHVHVHTEPNRRTRGYRRVAILGTGAILRPTLLPAVAIAVGDLPRRKSSSRPRR
jgi:Uma2 family endonuclease